MVDAPIKTQLELYIINYLDWQREGQYSLDMQRVILLEIIAQIVSSIEEGNYSETILLGGETVLLDDIATVSHSLLTQLLDGAKKNLTTGPWYRYLDGLLSDGESYIHNLLLGRIDAKRYGIALNTVAIMPNTPQNTAQLPQILKGFGIETAFLCADYPTIPLPFNWQAPDGSTILVIHYQAWDNPEQSIKAQADAQPDGPFVWMHHTQSIHTIHVEQVNDSENISSTNSTLAQLAQTLRQQLPDEFRPRVTGELHLEPLAHTSGRFSGRMAHKQAIHRLQSQLAYFAEPLFALSSTFGEVSFPIIQKSLLNHSWRLLIQNMSYEVLAGAVNDDVEQELTIRNRQIEDNSQSVINKALEGLSGTPYQPQNAQSTVSETYITVWNPHGYPVQQIVELQLSLPDGYYPNVLIDPDGEEQAFTWDFSRNILDFRASAPSIGYVVYTLKISKDKTAEYNQRRTAIGRSIGSASGASLGLIGERLDWTFANGNIVDLLNYYDGGDAGDIWQYQAPEPDVIVKGGLVDVVQVEATPTYERLIFRHRMRVAPNLKNGQERVRGLRVLDLTTKATYYNDLEGIYFRTQFTNSAEDHRLRAHLRTDIQASHIYTDSTFGVVKRPINTRSSDYPMQSFTTLHDDKRGLGLFTRGLTAIEPIKEDNQVTLALTLLRSVGWINKHKQVRSAGAQTPHDLEAEFMLMPLEPQQSKANLLRTGMSYRAPLRAIQYSEKPETTRHSYLNIDNDNVLMTALKAPESGDGLIMRLLNVSEGDSGVHIQAREPMKEAVQLNLAEEHQHDLRIEKNQVNISLEPNQVATIRLTF